MGTRCRGSNSYSLPNKNCLPWQWSSKVWLRLEKSCRIEVSILQTITNQKDLPLLPVAMLVHRIDRQSTTFQKKSNSAPWRTGVAGPPLQVNLRYCGLEKQLDVASHCEVPSVRNSLFDWNAHYGFEWKRFFYRNICLSCHEMLHTIRYSHTKMVSLC